MENKLPITRLTKFFSKDDFDLHMRVGQEYLHGDINMKVVLYRVDREKTETDDVYAEVGKDQVKFFPPVELNGIVRIEEPKNATYKNGIDRYLEPGNMIFSVYINHLEELKVDIGEGNFVTKSISETKEILENQTRRLEEIKIELNSALENLGEEITKTIQTAEEMEQGHSCNCGNNHEECKCEEGNCKCEK